MVTDDKARLTLLTQINDPETIQMKIIETQFAKFRTVTSLVTASDSDQSDFFTTVSK